MICDYQLDQWARKKKKQKKLKPGLVAFYEIRPKKRLDLLHTDFVNKKQSNKHTYHIMIIFPTIASNLTNVS